MKRIAMAADLYLPLDAVTQKFFFGGRTGSGKSYAATSMAEQMHGADAQIVALDPVGIWWGLRLAADGRSPGIAIPVFGGLHGDVPIEPTGGKLLADLIVDRGISAVLDVSGFEHDTEKARFSADFAARFYHRKKSSPSAVHVFLEECEEFIPQNPERGEQMMLHHFQRLIRRGRNFGIGASMISQRPQEVHKKALNQAECVFAFQLTGIHERKAVEVWIKEKGLDQDLAADLPKLGVGHAHVWSPAWLRVSKTVAIAKKQTFNASSTPEVGSRAAKTRELASIDLEHLRKEMKATIERAAAEDPKKLRARIGELERELAKKPAAATAPHAPAKRVEVPIMKPAELVRIESATKRLEKLAAQLTEEAKRPAELAGEIRALTARLTLVGSDARPTPVSMERQLARSPDPARPRAAVPVARRPSGNGHDEMSRMERAMLISLAQHPGGLSKGQVLLHTGYRSSGPVSTAFARLVSSGWIIGDRQTVQITENGFAALGEFEPLPTGDALREELLSGSKLSNMERALLRVVSEAYPNAIAKGAVLEAAKYASSGPVSTAFARLVKYGYVEARGRGELRGADALFGAGR